MTLRGRAALVALAVLVVFLLATSLREIDKRRMADTRRDRAIAALAATQDDVVDQLARILAQAARAEQAQLAPAGTVEKILERVEGLDPELIDRAVKKAVKESGVKIGATGPTGPPGPAGPAGPSATTSTATTATTATTAATTTTTTRPPATTTTSRPCTVHVLGVCARLPARARGE